VRDDSVRTLVTLLLEGIPCITLRALRYGVAGVPI
jgi:hypothetical protein